MSGAILLSFYFICAVFALFSDTGPAWRDGLGFVFARCIILLIPFSIELRMTIGRPRNLIPRDELT